MNLFKSAGILLLATIILYSCHTVEPEIDPSLLIIGTWNETKASDTYTDYHNKWNNSDTDLTNKSFQLVFTDDLKFSLFSNNQKLDSGTYFFEEKETKKYLYTISADNIRIPKSHDFKRRISEYEIVFLTKNKLKLNANLVELIANDEVLSVREFIWELSK